ncbi:MAG TPA: Mur ligase family protein [Nitrolancea sp.]|nr:Mur ligase family protein [Nitrolancea sp.]
MKGKLMADVKLSEISIGQAGQSISRPALPLVAVAGTRGKSTVAWLLETMLTASGRSVGLWCSTGVYIRGERQEGELGPWSRVLEMVATGDLDVAIQELDTTMVAAVGLPEHVYPLAAVSTLCGNNDECLISPEAIQGARAQSIVARAVRPDGLLVLNADDQAVYAAADETAADVVLFALHRGNPLMRRHLEHGGFGVWVEDGTVVIGSALDLREVVTVAEANFALDGALIFQVQNLLCAVALAVALDLPDSVIRRAVRDFNPEPDRLPGSCNILPVSGGTIVLDSVRQVWTLRSLIRGIRHQPKRRTVVVSGCFSHLPSTQIAEAGRLLGRLGGVVILHSQDVHGPLIDVLMDGIAQNEIPPLVLTMPGENQAIEHALRMIGEGDLCLLITDDVPTAVGAIERFRG